METTRKSPGLAIALSLIPGLGHAYVGQTAKGLVIFLITGVLGLFMVIGAAVQYSLPLLVVLTAPLYFFVVGPALVIYSMADSYRAAVARNARVASAVNARAGAPTELNEGGATPDPSRPTPSPSEGGWSMDLRQAGLWGVGLTGLGLFLVLRAAFPGVFRLGLLWPLLLLGFGLAVLWGAFRRRRAEGIEQ